VLVEYVAHFEFLTYTFVLAVGSY